MAAWGEVTAPIPASPSEMPWDLLINYSLSIYCVPTILHRSLHLTFSIILFIETFPCLESSQLGTGLKVQRKQGSHGAGVRKDRKEKTFSMVSLVMLTAHKPLSLKTNNNYNPQHQWTLAGFLCTQGSGREQAACTGFGARRAVSCSQLCPDPYGTLHNRACSLISKMD